MTKKRKPTNSKLDSHAFRDVNPEIVYNTQVPYYQGTEMEITPVFRVLPHLCLDNLELDLSGICFTEEYHDMQVAEFLIEQFLNVKK